MFPDSDRAPFATDRRRPGGWARLVHSQGSLSLLLGLGVFASGLTACASFRPRAGSEAPRLPTLPVRAVVLPAASSNQPAGMARALGLNPAAFAASAGGKLREAGWFESITLLPAAAGGPSSQIAADPLGRAQALEVHLAIEVSLHESPPTERRNSAWTPNLVLWLFTWVPSLFVRDFDYTAGATLEWRLLKVEDGSVLAQGRAEHRARRSLNHFERGGRYLGLVRAPTDAAAWRKIGSAMRPEVLDALHAAFMKDLAQALASPELAESLRDGALPRADTAGGSP